jgi:hypothetical protein
MSRTPIRLGVLSHERAALFRWNLTPEVRAELEAFDSGGAPATIDIIRVELAHAITKRGSRNFGVFDLSERLDYALARGDGSRERWRCAATPPRLTRSQSATTQLPCARQDVVDATLTFGLPKVNNRDRGTHAPAENRQCFRRFRSRCRLLSLQREAVADRLASEGSVVARRTTNALVPTVRRVRIGRHAPQFTLRVAWKSLCPPSGGRNVREHPGHEFAVWQPRETPLHG